MSGQSKPRGPPGDHLRQKTGILVSCDAGSVGGK